MTGSIPPVGASYQSQGAESPQERQKLFEIQFQTAVLGIYIAVSGQNGSCEQQLSHIKDGMKSGKATGELAGLLNQLVMQINQTIIPGKAPFPPFQFSTEGSQAQALTNHATTLEKCLNALAEYNQFPWAQEQPLFAQLTSLINTISQLSPAQAFDQINAVINQANGHLSSKFQIPPLTR
jgi:hypothetical protein